MVSRDFYQNYVIFNCILIFYVFFAHRLTEKEHELTQQSNLILQKEEQIKDLKYKLELIGNDIKVFR